MGENIDALVWRAEQADTHGNMFTAEALKQMAEAEGMRPGSDISSNFDFRKKVGYIVQAWIDGHDLYVTACFDDAHLVELLRQNELAIRPGFSIKAAHLDDAGRQVIDEVDTAYVAVVSDPMLLPGERQCALCEAPIPDDGGIDVCGRCIAELQS